MIAKVESPNNEAYCAPGYFNLIKKNMNFNLIFWIALGDAFGHMSQLRIQLSWKMNKREARVLKSPHLKESSTFFQITVRICSN